VRLDGFDLRDLTPASVRASVGTLLQEQLLFDATVRENVVYGHPSATEEELLAVARATGLDELVATLPLGYDTPVGQRGRALSGGQRQRVALARTLLRNTPVVVLDEPFTGLDDAGARRLLPGLRAFCEGRTTLLISHDAIAGELADRTVEVVDGRLLTQTPIAVPA
jgi:ATP-binding cassette subfamily B protein